MRNVRAAWGQASNGPIPEHVRAALQARLEQHARIVWAGRCRQVVVRFRGAYAYVDVFPIEDSRWCAVTPEEDGQIDSTPIRMCRLGYLGSVDRWAFAFYRYSDKSYEPSVAFSGAFEATPEEAFDCSAFAYLAA